MHYYTDNRHLICQDNVILQRFLLKVKMHPYVEKRKGYFLKRVHPGFYERIKRNYSDTVEYHFLIKVTAREMDGIKGWIARVANKYTSGPILGHKSEAYYENEFEYGRIKTYYKWSEVSAEALEIKYKPGADINKLPIKIEENETVGHTQYRRAA